ncbi:thiamine pyrophosphate-dependent enzyme [Desulfurispirillum indicum]|uniref:thiamine pyrophosphate-dependent enzyme n=1 Tax=Desulfurispirillum indicum TaxID=936456 RepID=UPI001CFB4D63|nr:thiamine pyrophosphate-dependent enzyme [Desulfurispirillum indicum]UCZ55981.1 thiamine pyrophosphate-dependent enzyme [Desulfurispirillum indicum]
MIEQISKVINGNEAVAEAIIHIGYEFEGYYPITPSSDAGQEVNTRLANGEADLSFVVGTSELAAIGICYGAALAGARTVDVTSANGLLLKLEQIPVISGTRTPMVLNLSTRCVSGPLNIKNDHTDLATMLGMGWLILMAKNVQEVYDMNIIALKLAEKVNLPVCVAYDGFHTSHGNRRVLIAKDKKDVTSFIGPKPKRPTCLDVEEPRTFGPYMNDDIINNKYQLHLAMQEAYEALPGLFAEFEAKFGRKYGFLDTMGLEKADSAMMLLNSAAESTKDAIELRKKEGKENIGLISFNVLRPFPVKEVVGALKNIKTLLVAERAHMYGATMSYLATEVAATAQQAGNQVKILNRVFGLGGLNFIHRDALAVMDQLEKANAGDASVPVFDYYQHWDGEATPPAAEKVKLPALEQYTQNEKYAKVDINTLKKLASDMPTRIEKMSSCPGCGIFTNLEMFLKGIDGAVILTFATGCGMVVTTGYPGTSFKVPYVHSLFHNAASTATGIVEHYRWLKEKGLQDREITVIAVGGDGASDIGMDQILGAALRNTPFIYIEYDNKVYANTGAQMCYTGFKGMLSTTSQVGKKYIGKQFHHKDIVEIMRGTHMPYMATIAETNPVDAVQKARKAQQTVRDGGMAFIKAFSVCPLNWVTADDSGPAITQAMLDSCLFPLYEIDHGITKLNYDPKDKKIPVGDALKLMGKATSHLNKPEAKPVVEEVQKEVDRRWERLIAMNEHPLL